MKKIVSMLLMVTVLCAGSAVFGETAGSSFPVYTDASSPDNHYIPSGWMGDVGDIAPFDDKCMDDPHSGSTCIKVTYTARRTSGQGWAGVYWQNPANNWGSKKGGFDLSSMNKLTVWMKGERGGEIIDKIMLGGIKGVYPDSSGEVATGPIQLTDDWQEYTPAQRHQGRA